MQTSEVYLIEGQTVTIEGVTIACTRTGRYSHGTQSAGCVRLTVTSHDTPTIADPGRFEAQRVAVISPPPADEETADDLLDTPA